MAPRLAAFIAKWVPGFTPRRETLTQRRARLAREYADLCAKRRPREHVRRELQALTEAELAGAKR